MCLPTELTAYPGQIRVNMLMGMKTLKKITSMRALTMVMKKAVAKNCSVYCRRLELKIFS
jgi:hypothetical protein